MHLSVYSCAGRPAIRVMNGNSSCQGRVEVRYKNIWGTVCDDNWDLLNANVVCRQLGCGQPIMVKKQAYFGYGSGPILLDNVECIGFEPQLSECANLGWGQHNCGHHEDAGVICARKSSLDFAHPHLGPQRAPSVMTEHIELWKMSASQIAILSQRFH